jgi:predicted  nucleic acid-binding Zn-ribbon protein
VQYATKYGGIDTYHCGVAYPDASLVQDIKHLHRLWRKVQADRRRDAIYNFLTSKMKDIKRRTKSLADGLSSLSRRDLAISSSRDTKKVYEQMLPLAKKIATDLKKLDGLVSSTSQALDTLLEETDELASQINHRFGEDDGEAGTEDEIDRLVLNL